MCNPRIGLHRRHDASSHSYILIQMFFMFICIQNYHMFIKKIYKVLKYVCATQQFSQECSKLCKTDMKVQKISRFVQIQSKPLNENYRKRSKSKPFCYFESKRYKVVVGGRTQEHLFLLHILMRTTGSVGFIGCWYGYMSKWW